MPPLYMRDPRLKKQIETPTVADVSIVVRSEFCVPLLPLRSLRQGRLVRRGGRETRDVAHGVELGEIRELECRDPANRYGCGRARIRDHLKAERLQLLHGFRRSVGELQLHADFALFIGCAT